MACDDVVGQGAITTSLPQGALTVDLPEGCIIRNDADDQLFMLISDDSGLIIGDSSDLFISSDDYF